MADAVVIATWVVVAVLFVLAIAATHRFKRSKGRNPLSHLIYGACAVAISFLAPTKSQEILFSAFAVSIFGALIPIYESIRAICTIEPDDDTSWLQYWCAMGAMFFLSSYLDDYKFISDAAALRLHQTEVFFYIWLWLPFTDGSTLIFDFITRPLLVPIMKPISNKCGGWLNSIAMAFVNAVHLWLLWAFFIFLPASIQRFVATATGAAYPIIASVVAVTTETSTDDTFWLTYWSCYGLLFILVDLVDQWLGKIPGFYAVVIFTTVYLMLPMFNGAESVFRRILVPLAGLKELLVLRDALEVKNQMLNSLPAGRQAEVSRAIAKFFTEDMDKRMSSKELRKSMSSSKEGYGSIIQSEDGLV